MQQQQPNPQRPQQKSDSVIRKAELLSQEAEDVDAQDYGFEDNKDGKGDQDDDDEGNAEDEEEDDYYAELIKRGQKLHQNVVKTENIKYKEVDEDFPLGTQEDAAEEDDHELREDGRNAKLDKGQHP